MSVVRDSGAGDGVIVCGTEIPILGIASEEAWSMCQEHGFFFCAVHKNLCIDFLLCLFS